MLSRNLVAIFLVCPYSSPDLHFRTVRFEAVIPMNQEVKTGMHLALHYFHVLPVGHFPLPHSNHLQYSSINTEIVLLIDTHTRFLLYFLFKLAMMLSYSLSDNILHTT